MKGIKSIAIILMLTSLVTSFNVSYAAEPEMMASAFSTEVSVGESVPAIAEFPNVAADSISAAVPSVSQELPTLDVSQAETPKAIEDKVASEISKVPEDLLPETALTALKTEIVTVMQKKQIEVEKTILEEVTVREGKGILGWNSFDVDSYGSYSLPASFVINPANGQFTSSTVYIENTGITDMVIYAESFRSLDWYSPTVVSPDTFYDWRNIGINDTYSYIALGLSIKDVWGNELCQYWFDDEWNQDSDVIFWLAPDEAVTVEIISKHGMCWCRPCTFSYECSIGVEVMPKKVMREKKVKVLETIEVPVQIEVPIQVKDVQQAPLTENMINNSVLSQIEKAPDNLIVP